MSGPLTTHRDDRGVVTVTLDRPDVRNAFDAELIDRIRGTFEDLATDDGARVVVLTGSGGVFCAGADLNWMSGMVDYSLEENIADSRDLEAMLRAVDECPRPVLARVNGHAFGGGTGLIACADISVGAEGALFGFTEVRLGLAPAVISPYVLPRIGPGNARRLFLTGERFDAGEAHRIGLLGEVCTTEALDDRISEIVGDLLAGGPHAQAESKRLVREVSEAGAPAAAADITVQTIARLRVSEEGQEGMQAFFDERDPDWRIPSG